MSPRANILKKIGGALTAVAVVAALAGCATPQAGGENTITFAIEGANLSAGHMDIHSTQLDVGALVLRNTFDSLVAQNADGKFVPWLAKSWTISDDGLHYTFQLRTDVKFQDGEPFNAEAVKANFDHVVDPKTASAQAASLIGYAEDGGYYIDTEVVGEFEVRVNFRQPYAPFLQGVSLPQLGFYSPKVLKDHADDLKAGGPGITVGTGPFILSEYTPDQELVFTANPDYNWPAEGSKQQGRAAAKARSASCRRPHRGSERSRAVRRMSPQTSRRTWPTRSARTSPCTRSSFPESPIRSTSTRGTACSPTSE